MKLFWISWLDVCGDKHEACVVEESADKAKILLQKEQERINSIDDAYRKLERIVDFEEIDLNKAQVL